MNAWLYPKLAAPSLTCCGERAPKSSMMACFSNLYILNCVYSLISWIVSLFAICQLPDWSWLMTTTVLGALKISAYSSRTNKFSWVYDRGLRRSSNTEIYLFSLMTNSWTISSFNELGSNDRNFRLAASSVSTWKHFLKGMSTYFAWLTYVLICTGLLSILGM